MTETADKEPSVDDVKEAQRLRGRNPTRSFLDPPHGSPPFPKNEYCERREVRMVSPHRISHIEHTVKTGRLLP